MHSERESEETQRDDDDAHGGEAAHAADPAEAARLTERILRGLGLDVGVAGRDSDEAVEIDITGPDTSYLLSRKGEALSAAQYLVNRILYRGRRGKKIRLDSGGFRKMREDEIVEIARRTADKVIEDGEESLLSPLNPYERRLVHLALSEIPGVETRSLGDGFLKRVAIFPAGRPGAGDPGRGRSRKS